jgi:hypothetical protein
MYRIRVSYSPCTVLAIFIHSSTSMLWSLVLASGFVGLASTFMGGHCLLFLQIAYASRVLFQAAELPTIIASMLVGVNCQPKLASELVFVCVVLVRMLSRPQHPSVPSRQQEVEGVKQCLDPQPVSVVPTLGAC